jgi:hypothetical protein
VITICVAAAAAAAAAAIRTAALCPAPIRRRIISGIGWTQDLFK